MRSIHLRRIAALAALLVTGLTAGTSHAFVVYINEFSVVRNGAAFFTDTFGDGVVPPSGPNGAETYNVFGTIAAGAESGGSLQLDSALGAVTANALGQARIEVRSRLLTNIDAANLQAGLKSDDTLELTGIFSLTTPSGVLNPQYAIRFNDASGGSGAHQLLQLQVRFDTANGVPEIRYLLQDFDLDIINVLGVATFAPPQGADEIRLQISRPDVNNDNFFASYSYLSGGAVVGGATFATPGLGFQGENFVRAEFNIADGFQVPEPASLALLGIGLVALGFSRRRA